MAQDGNWSQIEAMAREMDDPESPTRKWLAEMSAQMDDPESPVRKQLAEMAMQWSPLNDPSPTFWQEVDTRAADKQFWEDVFGTSFDAGIERTRRLLCGS